MIWTLACRLIALGPALVVALLGVVANWTTGAEATTISNAKGWLRRGAPGQMASAAYVLRDGVFVTISSFRFAPEELLKVASSLEARAVQAR